METRIKGVLSPKASGSITITENGNYDVVDVANAVVEVKPSGTIEITENGEHDVANYEKANVNVVDENGKDAFDVVQTLVYSIKPTDSSMFKGKDIVKMPKGIDYSTLNRSTIFSGCSKLEEAIDYNTSSVTNHNSFFRDCTSLKYIINLDCASSTSIQLMCQNDINLLEVSLLNTEKLQDLYSAFQNCSLLEKVSFSSLISVTTMQQAFVGCSSLKEFISPTDTPNLTTMINVFGSCTSLETIKGLNLINCTSLENLNGLANIKNLEVYNIKLSWTIGYYSYYGHLLTLESLLHTIKELIDTGSSKKLTIGTSNLPKLANVYVKITSTEPDENGNIKLPFEVCESTDEGAMLITNYVSLKNWALA